MCFFFFFFKFPFEDFIYLFLERGREREREGEKHQGVVAFQRPPTGGLASNPGMCPDGETNRRPVGSLVLKPLSHTSQGRFFVHRVNERELHVQILRLKNVHIKPHSVVRMPPGSGLLLKASLCALKYPKRRDGYHGWGHGVGAGVVQACPLSMYPAFLGLGCPLLSSIFHLSPLGEFHTKIHFQPDIVNK